MRDDASPQPSRRAVDRLAADVGHEVGDLRARLAAAVASADDHTAAGRPDLAAQVLEEQRAALVEVHARLASRLADAAVEREAEAVLADAHADAVAPAASDDAVHTAVKDALELAHGTSHFATAGGLQVLAAAASIAGALLLLLPGSGGAHVAAGWGSVAEDVPGGSTATADNAAADESGDDTAAQDPASTTGTAFGSTPAGEAPADDAVGASDGRSPTGEQEPAAAPDEVLPGLVPSGVPRADLPGGLGHDTVPSVAVPEDRGEAEPDGGRDDELADEGPGSDRDAPPGDVDSEVAADPAPPTAVGGEAGSAAR